MSTTSPHELAPLDERHVARWHQLHEKRRFRVEQLAALAAEPSWGRHTSVQGSLRMAAGAVLREIDAALARMDEGRYGRCVECAQPLPESRLDAFPMASLCLACHYNEQNCRLSEVRT